MMETHWKQIAAWPSKVEISYPSQKAFFCHGTPMDPIFGYLYEWEKVQSPDIGHDLVFMGNTHRPFIRHHREVTLVNVGSCGMPRNDGRFGSGAIYDPTSGEVELVRFDILEDLNRLEAKFANLEKAVWSFRERQDPRAPGKLIA